MSEEILKALTQLFAIISKQDGGVTNSERDFVENYFKLELDTETIAEYMALYDKYAGVGKDTEAEDDESKRKTKRKLTSVRDSVRTLALCRKINKTLNQKQKVIVLVKLLELLASDRTFTPQRMEIINTVSTVFNIPTEEFQLLERFVVETHSSKIDHEEILIFDDERPAENSKIKFIDSGLLDGEVIFVRVKSVNLYFAKYTGSDTVSLNGQQIMQNSIVLYSPGSVLKTPKGAPLYYADLVNSYTLDAHEQALSFNVKQLEYRFPNGALGLRGINLSENQGTLVGIMGASGAGKTTLLNTLAGLEHPSSGSVKINSYDVHRESQSIEGVIGYIAQDDLLIEELTVYQNLYYNAKLCFRNMSEKELDARVVGVLESLGLDKIKNLVVGNVLNKKISGGQRKRLNIALELIREPAVLFVDEPTSGLSSRDSENVIDLLKELTLRGKLIFVVIHQPSSDIYKMFDKMIILDTGGYQIFYGNPIEAIEYFKGEAGQIDADRGQCPTCGNVNPEQVFNIVEAKVVDEYGEFTNKRKVAPKVWEKQYKEKIKVTEYPDIRETPPSTLAIPNKIKQFVVFTVRDFLSKISNTQYMIINLLEAPLLALLLSWIIRYRQDADADYLFRHNDNVPAYILICIIISLFMGLTVSAEEIIKDRKIKRRESFLNLSQSAYLASKIAILFLLSAIQTLQFILVGNLILDVEGMYWTYWLALFTVSCHANVLGLNISSAFNSAVTVYIIIPILLIPQMILSGLIFDYDKLNNTLSEHGKVPLIADFMASRWAYEAISVRQFKKNIYENDIFEYNLDQSSSNYKMTYWKPKMEEQLDQAMFYIDSEDDSLRQTAFYGLEVLNNELEKDPYFVNNPDVSQKAKQILQVDGFDFEKGEQFRQMLNDAYGFYSQRMIRAGQIKDSIIHEKAKELPEGVSVSDLKDQHFNEQLEELVRNNNTLNKNVVQDGEIIQLKDPIYNPPTMDRGFLDYRTQFFAPYKVFFGKAIDTFSFNILAIWLMTFVLYLTLYFEVLKKVVSGLERLGSRLSNNN